MKKYRLILTFIFAATTFWLQAQNAESLFSQSVQAYNKGNYALAISLLDSLHHQNQGSASTFYNEGNAYYQLKNYPQAILNYERALRLDNGNDKIINNLNLANKQLTDNISPIPELFIFRWWKWFAFLLSPMIWAVFAFIFLVIGLSFAISYRISPSKNKMQIMIMSLFFALIGRFAFLTNYEYRYQQENAIIMQQEAELKEKPGAENPTKKKIIAGVKVSVVETLGDWVSVKLPNGEKGWLAQKSIEKI